MSKIIYPTLDLFIYDLRNGLGENKEEILHNSEHFYKKIPASVWPTMFERDTGFEDEYVELLGQSKNKKFTADGETYPLKGYYYPVRLGDTYGLLLDCSVDNLSEPQPVKSFAVLRKEIESRLDNNTGEPQPAKSFAALREEIEKRLDNNTGESQPAKSFAAPKKEVEGKSGKTATIGQRIISNILAKSFAPPKKEVEGKLDGKTATIGQTWMISGILPASDKASLNKEACPTVEEIAKACYQQLMPDSQWDEILQGQFMGATIFELWHYNFKLTEDGAKAATNIQSIQDDLHIVIILYPNLDIAKKAAEFYQYWMRLFYYRHKILWSYGQSRLLKLKLKKYLVTIHNCINDIEKSPSSNLNFQQLREKLTGVQKILNPYSIALTYLDFQKSTIDMNFSNYQKCSSSLKEKAGWDSNIAFFKKFSELVKDKYLLQIAKDYDNLSLGFKLLDTSINTLRSRVEIDKAAREGAFRNTISVLGLAIAANSAVVAHAKNFPFYNNPQRAREHPVGSFLYNNFNVAEESLGSSIVLVLGLGAALIAASITQLVIRWRRGNN